MNRGSSNWDKGGKKAAELFTTADTVRLVCQCPTPMYLPNTVVNLAFRETKIKLCLYCMKDIPVVESVVSSEIDAEVSCAA